MPELGSSGSVRGALRNERPYRERYTISVSLGAPVGIRIAMILLTDLVPSLVTNLARHCW